MKLDYLNACRNGLIKVVKLLLPYLGEEDIKG